MPKHLPTPVSQETWGQIKLAYENTGESVASIARRFGLSSPQRISSRATAERWARDTRQSNPALELANIARSTRRIERTLSRPLPVNRRANLTPVWG